MAGEVLELVFKLKPLQGLLLLGVINRTQKQVYVAEV